LHELDDILCVTLKFLLIVSCPLSHQILASGNDTGWLDSLMILASFGCQELLAASFKEKYQRVEVGELLS